MKSITFRSALGLSALSATLISLSFVPYNIFPVGFLGLIPLFYLFTNFVPTKKQMFYLWATWILILNFISYHWIMHTIAVYGMMPTFVAFPLFLLYTLGTGGKMLFFFIFLKWMQRRGDIFDSNTKRTLAVAAAFGICEIIGWQLFPWHGGNIVSGDLWYAQAADLIGTRGLSVVWAALQYLLYITATEYFFLYKRSIPQVLKHSRSFHIFLGIFIFFHGYGAIRFNQFRTAENDAPKIQVGVPQGNVPLITRQHERPYIISRMVAQTQKLVSDAIAVGKKPDLIVWPESSIPAMEFERSMELKLAIADLQKFTNTPLIINDIYHDNRKDKDYSNMWHLDSIGQPLNNYQKNFLLPFGEFMPMGETFPSLKNFFPAVSDFSHGEKFSLFEIATKNGIVKAMPLVCYEVILPEYARGFDGSTNHESQFIINITNDAWFGDTIESLQHMTLGVMRAIELRLPIIRSTNSGISAYIASTGEVSGQTKLFERVNQLYQVAAMPRAKTLFAIAGNAILYIFLALAGGFFGYQWFRRRA
jgi:apolipoprotein N-acyltransferase